MILHSNQIPLALLKMRWYGRVAAVFMAVESSWIWKCLIARVSGFGNILHPRENCCITCAKSSLWEFCGIWKSLLRDCFTGKPEELYHWGFHADSPQFDSENLPHL